MKNSLLALFSTTNLSAKTKELENLWEKFVTGGNPYSKNLRKSILDSWNRCQEYGVDPHQKRTNLSLSKEQLNNLLQNSQLFEVAKPIINDLAFHTLGTGYLITLCDKNGRIIYLNGENNVLTKAEEMNFVTGADWSEQAIGTNAIGTSISTRNPTQIFSAEHFCEGCHPWTCSSSPIIHPFTKEIVGAIDLTGIWHDAQPHSLGLAISSAIVIEQQLKHTYMEIHNCLIIHFYQAVRRWKGDSIIILNTAMNIVKADSYIYKKLNFSSWLDLQNRPELRPLINELVIHSQSTDIANSSSQVEIPDLNIKAYIERIYHEQQHVGYLIIFQNKSSPKQSPVQLKKQNSTWHDIIGHSESFQEVLNKCQKVADTSVSILITGESGTGKEKIAQTIHNTSLRKDKAFIPINCGAIPKELITSELFGYESGTFTGGSKEGKKGKFEEAHEGTLFLDEIGEMPLDLQVHLLRVLQEKEVIRLGSSTPKSVNVRIIAATNKNLEIMVKQGQFREDLFYRLNVISIHIPSLHKRFEDIPLLAHHFVEKFAQKYDKQFLSSFDEETLSFLKNYHWPGNIRELQNALEHGVIFCDSTQMKLKHLPSYLSQSYKQMNKIDVNKENTNNDREQSPIEIEEKKMLIHLLEKKSGNLSAVARKCNISRSTLYRKLKKYNIR